MKDHEKNIGQTTDTPRGNGTRSAGFRGGLAGNTLLGATRAQADETKHHIAGTPSMNCFIYLIDKMLAINLRVLRALRGNIKMLSFQINKV